MNGDLVDFNRAMVEPGHYTAEDIRQLGNVSHLYWDQEARNVVLEKAHAEGSLTREPVRFKRKDGTP